ncbi:MAG TPA: sugar ABC transporter substrate-binding protein, partial [Clostridia bacterium]
MIKIKRLGCIIFSIVLVCSLLLSGCSSTPSTKPTNSDASGNSNKAADNSTASNLEPYEINAYFLAPQCKDLSLVQEELNKLLKKKINATIKLNYYWWDSYQQKQQL